MPPMLNHNQASIRDLEIQLNSLFLTQLCVDVYRFD